MDAGELFEIVVTFVIGGIVILALLSNGVTSDTLSVARDIIVVAFFVALAIAFVSQIIE
jgi:hypothetical protein